MFVAGIDDELDRAIEVSEGGLYLLLGGLVQGVNLVYLARVSLGMSCRLVDPAHSCLRVARHQSLHVV